MSVRIKSLNTNLWKQGDDEGDQEFCERKRNVWKVILDGIIRPMDQETVLLLQEVPGREKDKAFRKMLRDDLADEFDIIAGFEASYQALETVVIARRGLIGEIDSIPDDFSKQGRKNRYVPFVIHSEARDINALAVHAGLDGDPAGAEEIVSKLKLLESLGAKYDIIAGDFNSGLELSPSRNSAGGVDSKLKNKLHYCSLLNGGRFRDAIGDRTKTYKPNRNRPPLTSIDHILVGDGLSVADPKVVFLEDDEKFEVRGHIFDHALIQAVVSVER